MNPADDRPPGTGLPGPLQLAGRAFDQIPREMVVRAIGVDYGHLRPPEGGDLYVTRLGWPFLEHLLPASWFTGKWYAKSGARLSGATGMVYRVPSRPGRGKPIDLVVKFSRMAEELPIQIATTFPRDISEEEYANARFNSPMEEFGLLTELRAGGLAPSAPRTLLQRPLAIYAPPEEFEHWQLGRSEGRFATHWHLLSKDQEASVKAIELDIRRMYVLIFGWIEGKDAEEACTAGELTLDELRDMTLRVEEELRNKGFRILDNKPKHFIVRNSEEDGAVVRRKGNPIFALVDYELLQRTPRYQGSFRAMRRERYWTLQGRRMETSPGKLPTHLKPMTVFGVDYLLGNLPDRGQVWVVGRNPDLYDFFLASRWRRTPRIRLSLHTEVYYTRTIDGVDLVYHHSRVGSRPVEDPFNRRGRRIRQHGFNSPFEVVAIAEALRRHGISTTVPVAICRSGHRSEKARYLFDPSRFTSHTHLQVPGSDPEPILRPDHDYYDLWGHFSGTADQSGVPGIGGSQDLQRAHENGLVADGEFEELAGATHGRLQALGLAEQVIDPHELVVFLGEDGRLLRDDQGKIRVALGLDALTAYDYDLLSEYAYRDLIGRLDSKLDALGCEKLDLSGNDVLLLMEPSGKFCATRGGNLSVTLCSFELLRGFENLIAAHPCHQRGGQP
jgi:hypothetical protein